MCGGGQYKQFQDIAMEEEPYATVDEVIAMLQKLSNNGFGNYLVTCGREYYLARKDEIPEINHKNNQVDLGGYQ